MRRGSVGIRLALFLFRSFRFWHEFFAARFIYGVAGLHAVSRLVPAILVAAPGRFVTAALLPFFFLVHFFVYTCSRRERFPGQYFNGRFTRSRKRGRRCISVTLAVIVVFEVFENVAHIQERISIQADIHECGLHARQDACDFSFVDAADERKFFLALNVDLD